MGNSSTIVRILLVEDHEPFRDFLRTTLQARPELHVIGETSDGLQAVQKAEELRPDLILLDIGLPTLNGIEAAHRIRKLSINSKIVLRSANRDLDIIQEAFRSGIRGYVLKSAAGSQLFPAVKAVIQGEPF